MSDRPLIQQYPSIVNGDMSAPIIGKPSVLLKVSMCSFAFTWAGAAPVGSVSIQVSNDYTQNADGTVKNPGTWNTLTVNYQGTPVQTVPVSGNTGNGFIDIDATAAYAIRPIYTPTSGTGTLNCITEGKVT